MNVIREQKNADVVEIVEPDAVASFKKDSLRTKLLLISAGVLISLLVLEVVVRIFEKRFTPQAWSDRPNFWYLPEDSPDSRDRYIDPVKGADVYRIIVIGDSFTFGARMQFDDTFPKRLERMLNLNDQQRKVEVLNWGVPGYSTAQEATLVKRALRSYHPDLIVLQITLNDPELKPYRVTHKGQDRQGHIELTSPIFQYWKTLRLVTERYYNTILRSEAIQYYQDLFSNEETSKIFHDSLGNIITGTNEAQVPLVAVLFPLFSDELNAHYPYANLHQKVASEFEGKNATFIDLLPHFQGIPIDRLQVSPGIDSHPGEVAHRIAAEQILDTLNDRRILPDDVRPKNIRSGKERRLSSPFPHGRKTEDTREDGATPKTEDKSESNSEEND